MQNRLCVVVANLKPANMKGIKSHAMVLAASSADGKKVRIHAAWPCAPSTSAPLLPACIHRCDTALILWAHSVPQRHWLHCRSSGKRKSTLMSLLPDSCYCSAVHQQSRNNVLPLGAG